MDARAAASPFSSNINLAAAQTFRSAPTRIALKESRPSHEHCVVRDRNDAGALTRRLRKINSEKSKKYKKTQNHMNPTITNSPPSSDVNPILSKQSANKGPDVPVTHAHRDTSPVRDGMQPSLKGNSGTPAITLPSTSLPMTDRRISTQGILVQSRASNPHPSTQPSSSAEISNDNGSKRVTLATQDQAKCIETATADQNERNASAGQVGSSQTNTLVLGILKTDLTGSIATLGNIVGYLGQIDSRHDSNIDGKQLFTRNAQGLTQRHPYPDISENGQPDDRLEILIEKNRTYDGASTNVKRLASFDVDASNAVTYKVGDKSVLPTFEQSFQTGYWKHRFEAKWQAFQLNNGHYMIPQPRFMDCTAACCAMICMAWGMPFDEAISGLDLGVSIGKKWIQALTTKTGVQPIVLHGNLATEQGKRAFGQALQQYVRDYGPGILERFGHVSMLYSVTLNADGDVQSAEIGDPFHGTHCEIPEGDELWAHWEPNWQLSSKTTSAVFLPQYPFAALDTVIKDVGQFLTRDDLTAPDLTTFAAKAYQHLETLRESPRHARQFCNLLKEHLCTNRFGQTENRGIRAAFLKTAALAEQQYLAGENDNSKSVRREAWRPLVGEIAVHFKKNDKGSSISGLGLDKQTTHYLNSLMMKKAQSRDAV